jgi:hypothetical protein
MPVTYSNDTHGWAGWGDCETSETHLYAWEQPLLFFSANIYTRGADEPKEAIRFTPKYLSASEIRCKDV